MSKDGQQELLEALELTADEVNATPAPFAPNRKMRRAAERGTHAGSKGHKHKRRGKAYGRPESTKQGAIVHAIVRRAAGEDG